MRGSWPRLLLFVAVTPFLLEGVVQAVAFDADWIYTRTQTAVQLLLSRSPSGHLYATAFGIDEHGLFLTAYHAVRGATSLELIFPKEHILYPVRLVGAHAPLDLALLKVERPSAQGWDTPRWAVLRFGDSEAVRVGDPVAVLGNPAGGVRVLTVGRVLALHASIPHHLPRTLIRFEGVVRTGSSGSPLLDSRAQVVGMVIGVSLIPGNNGALAVSSRSIQEALPALLRGARGLR